ncbi:tetratricopeptide repeat protein [Zavarzinella formosa]|uniref:tetratricopeptide repeat protein n=1 Tax=Zavarzinella formosa TaxID=360055 RepID=UPI00031C00F8|nr:tetratricopeptide repeat protein [Zavarzinella formosa]
MKPFLVSVSSLLFMTGTGVFAAPKVGDVVVTVIPAELKPTKGEPARLTPGACLTVLSTNDGLTVATGRVGKIDPAAVMPLTEAIAHLTKQIDADPKDAAAWLAKGKIAFHQNLLDKAIADLDENLKLAANSEARSVRGFAWKRKGDKEKAMADFDEAIRLDPKNGLAWRVRGATWAAKADYGKAMADYTEAIRVDAGNPDALHHRVNLLAACTEAKYRDGKQAVADATKACELTGYENPLYLAGLATANAEAGDFPSAVKWQAKAIELTKAAQSKAAMQTRLEEFKDKKPFRMTWK